MSTEIMKVKEEVRLREGTAEVKACRESGMTVRAWCSENGIKPKNYYYHLKRVREAILENRAVPVGVNSGFFKKLIAFFKELFKLFPNIEIKP